MSIDASALIHLKAKLISLLRSAAFLAIRLVAVLAIYAYPCALAAFVAWSYSPAEWGVWLRAFVALVWLAATTLFFLAIFGDSQQSNRKAGR